MGGGRSVIKNKRFHLRQSEQLEQYRKKTMALRVTLFPQPRKQCPPLTWQDLARPPGLSDRLLCPNSDLCLGTPSREAQSPQEEKPSAFPGSGVGLSASEGAVWCPARPSPRAPTAPSRRQMTGGGRNTALIAPAAGQLGTADLQSEPGALPTVLALRRLTYRLGHFLFLGRSLPYLLRPPSLPASSSAAASASRIPLLELFPPGPSLLFGSRKWSRS